ncbi:MULTISPECIES: pantoate--beta-alanine ligase [Myroides]|uniref:Pantothenate synthetase n=2 Tax=Myroides odoratimimus TaxID=76832 RepID=A0A0S7EAL9_9FLAO|nr:MULTISPECIES: pantoate--beta-alanine ligase [Myroides]AJA68465.1 pantoate--beta-alanine ligase [Myroides sp. A21]ALU25743.1 pantoate--beta-alanine ligase [Myroides odoratimimus]EHO10684.1 pantoate-beta-alanine ligase [Myroides odoratimimus CCUG 10230]EHO14850.1 pantoate-beta-alanine ligase [Myroides odoratimimus CCUG 12901]MCS7472858.1 pantoate--beta-alanine ligase [Myroides odoratimimus]
MFLFSTKAELQAYLKPFRDANKAIGLVPTMGAIHKGHLSLMEQSLNENECTVVSIFVNPTQFNNAEDLEKYPRTLERDQEIIKSLSEQIVIFAPSVDEIYGGNTVAQSFDFDGLENEMEGASRPGHFDGVGTIVSKLFELVTPNKAYFGEKDFQQLQIIRKMVDKLHIPVQVIGVPIFRATDGLAMSSRNERVSTEGLEKSTFLYQVLLKAKDLFKSESISKVNAFVENEFKNNPNFELEYFTIAEEDTLKTATSKNEAHRYRGFLVAHIEGIRLIDNISFN